ncbi:MAG: hypothetical protein COW01_02780 [Bdellovibrionales bacterium CG12_big_fil_rev_8_21_14_0_65_38_15]|nr:MAG: hypothetical protein COW79_08445 [Bdellovibrionales bacterium CG22_combo_CG10-13_8_21_14_all_38_13]PIQ57018.1 MAG: hypothetical protein COW01_02780 [Bdellovibrionales bacterium CG12_big_fil_rev_8_21_14_0_65_38_15]PIR29021.1 MAG: hypothetical protein COV38_12340 [Bdellovibrionales bacterium CG11_big_fil_rev_8_21_14_0_20_38_13]
MKELLGQALLARYSKRSLGHFYILNSSSEDYLKQWSKDFVLSVLFDQNKDANQNERRFNQGHPDLLWLTPEEDHYKIENKDFDPLFQAMAHKPLELPWKFIFVEKPQTIGSSYANKLLKTLEEPTDHCTIFFLNAGATPLLSTVESRAIKLNLNPPEPVEELTAKPKESLADFMQRWTAQYPNNFDADLEFSNQLPKLAGELSLLSKGKYENEAIVIQGLLNWSLVNIENPKTIEEILDASKHHQHSKAFNSSINERIFSLVTTLS